LVLLSFDLFYIIDINAPLSIDPSVQTLKQSVFQSIELLETIKYPREELALTDMTNRIYSKSKDLKLSHVSYPVEIVSEKNR